MGICGHRMGPCALTTPVPQLMMLREGEGSCWGHPLGYRLHCKRSWQLLILSLFTGLRPFTPAWSLPALAPILWEMSAPGGGQWRRKAAFLHLLHPRYTVQVRGKCRTHCWVPLSHILGPRSCSDCCPTMALPIPKSRPPASRSSDLAPEAHSCKTNPINTIWIVRW